MEIRDLVEEIKDLRRRVEALEQKSAELQGVVKAVAILTPVLFTLLNLFLKVLKVG